MEYHLSYYATGEKFFREGETIYINKALEEIEPHLHAHSFIEIAYVAAGHGIHRIRGKEYTVSKGNLFIINYDVPHEFRSLPGNPKVDLVIYNCIFQPDFLDYSLVNCKDFSNITHHLIFKSLFPEEIENPTDINLLEQDSKNICDIYEKMHHEYKLMEPGYLELLRAYLIELLIKIFRLHHQLSHPKDHVETMRNQIIDKAINYMKNNYSQNLKLEDLSLMAFLSKNYFCKLFKESTGMTVFEYTQKIRIEEACKLLQKTDKKIIDIGNEVGYMDLKFFTQIFKRNTGKTPGEYRKAAVGD
ncbi:MAG TPA: AraC family transcriptional regulator [Ruminiclostridium sp.]